MDYDQSIQEIISVLKADKSVIQPWRNYAIKHLMEAQAHICKGLSTTYREPEQRVCTCPEGGMRKDCPVHGGKG